MIKEGFTRVSKILSPYTGYGSIPAHILDAKAEIGTQVHKRIEGYLKGIDIENENPLVETYFKSAKSWLDSVIFEPILIEERLYCDKYKITGEPDLLIKSVGKICLIDWKTSIKENITWQAQGSAYSYLAEINGYGDINQIAFIQLDKNGEWPRIYQYKVDFEEFLFLMLNYDKYFKNSKQNNLAEI